MKEWLIKRKKNEAGFTLAETLIAILILVMVSAIVAGALPAASNVFAKTVDSANAQVLLSTTMTVLREELGTAANVEEDGLGGVSYNNGSRRIAYLDRESPPGIWLIYKNGEGDSTEEQKRLLVSEKAATQNMIVSFEDVEVTAEKITFTGLKVTKDGYEDEAGAPLALASQGKFVIRKVS